MESRPKTDVDRDYLTAYRGNSPARGTKHEHGIVRFSLVDVTQVGVFQETVIPNFEGRQSRNRVVPALPSLGDFSEDCPGRMSNLRRRSRVPGRSA